MNSTLMTITPEMAAKYLEFNRKGNRNVKRGWVNDLAFAIRNGEWKISPNGISFDEEGYLIDGQHRLLAIEKAGIPVECYVTFDAPKDAFNVIDRGAGRTVYDIAKMKGFAIDTSALGAATFLVKYLTKRTLSKVDGLVLRFVEENIDTLYRVHLSTLRGAHRPLMHQSPMIAACWCAYMDNVEIDVIDRFCEVANSGFCGNDGESAAIVLRNGIANLDGMRATLRAEYLFPQTQNAIACFAKNTPRRKMWNDPKAIYFDDKKAEEIISNLIKE